MKEKSFSNDVLPLKNILYRLALRITQNAQEAQDIVQDTLLKVWSKREQWNEIESIEAFSLAICRNLALDTIKSSANKNSSIDENVAQHQAKTFDPLEQTLQNDRVQTIKKIIDALPEKQKTCIQLRDIEGKQYKEIAQILQISEEQVKINIFRARKAVKETFKKVDNYGL